MHKAKDQYRNRTDARQPKNRHSLSELVLTLHAIGYKTLEKVHKRTLQRIRRSNARIEQIFEREAVRQATNLKPE